MKRDKKYVIVPNKLHPSQINELSICCFIIKQNKYEDLLEFVVNNGGRVISSVSASGAEKNALLESLNGFVYDNYVVFVACPEEIVDTFMLNICQVFEFNKKKKGLAFVLDVLGYMGAKGPFVE